MPNAIKAARIVSIRKREDEVFVRLVGGGALAESEI
jgi:hypothetical protein